MPTAWYVVQYRRDAREGAPGPSRYCEMDDYSEQIYSGGGQWSETEVLGGYALVKVRASQAILDALASLFRRLPVDKLDDPLSSLSPQVKATLRDWILDMGYEIEEIRNRFGDDLGQYTLRDVMKFMARRRLKPRYDVPTDEIVLDGPVQPVKPVETVDAEVPDDGD